MRCSAPGWRNTLAVAAALTIIGAAFPRLSSRARWPTRLGLRGRLLYIAFSTAFGFGVRGLARRMREGHERAVAELRAELGRDPTDEELHAQLVRRGSAVSSAANPPNTSSAIFSAPSAPSHCSYSAASGRASVRSRS